VEVFVRNSGDLGQARFRVYFTPLFSNCGSKAIYVATRDVEIKDADCCTWVADVNGNIYAAHKFGDAGCWMTENLAVTKNEKLGSAANLTNTDTAQNEYAPLYTRPKVGDDTTTFLEFSDARNSDCYGCGIGKPGLLYNWAAAVGAKSASDAQDLTIYPNEGGINVHGNISSPDSKDEDICPVGWYLPSDAEWYALENEIHKNRGKYSSVSGTGRVMHLQMIQILMANICARSMTFPVVVVVAEVIMALLIPKSQALTVS
jgi:uncharacterized protein (TIGR02145 family)